MGWWDFGENRGFPGNELAIFRLECAFCQTKGNFATVHHDLRKHPVTGKVLNYDILRCENCGNLTMVFWSAETHSVSRAGAHDFMCLPYPRSTTRFPEHWPA
jgi:hypothetical protein